MDVLCVWTAVAGGWCLLCCGSCALVVVLTQRRPRELELIDMML